ncbi:restriction endonuclease subunit S [Poseidonibacter sp. 1_MG-2023]|uniref:restriction endonuclease subunit S n=1 Tax=Poseidonibacter TaxID=2321187 RepID=UPI001E5F4FF6|nr:MULTISPECIES: restriction endonuclease subunit S [Poseidonibacter]MDO6827932.1 restriction endonuclease subunit S [Poseidonibacter sp. 1_MG-2023]
MKIKMNHLTTIKTGLVLSRKKASQQSEFKKDYNVISLKSFSENGYYNHSFAEDFTANEEIKEENLLQKGDILIRLREPNIAVYIDEDYTDTIISSLAAIIRTKKCDVNPLFLVNYLNSSYIKRQLYSQGSAVSMLNVKFIGELEIILPPKETQNKVAEIQALSNKEINLLNQLIEEKQKYTSKVFETIINQEITND